MRQLMFALAAAALSVAASAQPDALLTRARALHKQYALIDGHNDYPWALREKDKALRLETLDLAAPQPSLHTDIARLRAGGVGMQFWSVYVPTTLKGEEAVRATFEQIDLVHRMTKKWPETFELARTSAEAERIFKAGKIASMIGMEGGHSINESLETLRKAYAAGARYMTLTHSASTPWADASPPPAKLGGLTPFGEQVVREMNRLGMLVDLSHVAPETMEDALRVTAAPVIFSHSSARALTDHHRNVPDSILKMLPKNGGVVMVTFVPEFISPAVRAHQLKLEAERSRVRAMHKDEARVTSELAAWSKTNPAPRATLAQVADHIDHIRKVAGIDHIGLGGDFDGITTVVQGLEDVSTYPALTAELLRRGYSDSDIAKLLGQNTLRVWRSAEQVASRLAKSP